MTLSEGVWNGPLLGFVRGEIVPCRFCGGPDGDGHLFWECPHSPLVRVRESPEFHDLWRLDRSTWRRCLLWHGWLPALACSGGASPSTTSNDDIADARLERILGDLVKRRKTRVSVWLWRHGSVCWPCIDFRDVDVGFWPYSVGLLVKLCFFSELSALALYCQ